ncbi:family S53 protease-like protein [Mycena alexandri]|uniref:tripeptidyl-peptidase II n=1 Tax=Mycena alexandri TaxID=1745969 RepID=A0AAD6SG72_9AGAR|nr:family S53 protease-like protein [Mycena alexandri]
MGFRKLLAFLSLIATAAGRMVVQQSRPNAPPGFVSQGPAPPTETLTLRMALTSNNVAGLHQKLTSIATPGSSDFRQWLSADEVKSFIQPAVDTVTAFNTWASANGLKPTDASPSGDWVSITLPVSHADTLFGAKFEIFTHPDITDKLVRTLSVSLPSELVGHVDVIQPSTDFIDPNPRLAPRASIRASEKRATPASCDTSDPAGIITPTCLQKLYGIPTTPATQSTNTLLVTGYGDQWPQTADLSNFLQQFRPDIPSNTTFSLLTADGGVDPQGQFEAGVEANLDIDYTTGIATGVPIQFLSVGGGSTLADFAQSLLDTTTFFQNVTDSDLPSVMTTSYGSIEANFGAPFATKICNGFAEISARGVSVIFASGDGGVRGNHDSEFMPVFPAACPWVTSTGATIGIPEQAVNFTGGGFSVFFPTPDYQTQAVASFLETVPSDFAGQFNRTGRGYPDVSLQGWNFDIVSNNVTGTVSGTSASAPSFAAIIALINDRLVAAGKPVLGFLNPFIYASQSAFTDITVGHNSGSVCPSSAVAFDATAGWDPLSGVGTPIFDKLLAAALA